MEILKSLFGQVNSKSVYSFTLMNVKRNSICIINYGASIISWQVKDKNEQIPISYWDLIAWKNTKKMMFTWVALPAGMPTVLPQENFL